MIETNETTYLAVITLSLPLPDETATARIIVKASDTIEASDGQIKRLGDCTLADLQTYADSLEADVWQAYQAIRLADLTAQTGIALTVRLANELEPSTDLAALLDHVLIPASMPPAAASEAAASEAAASEAAASEAAASESAAPERATSEPDVEGMAHKLTEEGGSEMAQAEAAVKSEGAMPAQLVEAAPPAEEHEPNITVAESEPVHEEREARLDAPARPLSLPHVRILGKRRPLGHPTWAAVDILINEPAFRDAQAHALSSMDREVAGMLVGPPPEKQPDGRYLAHITDIIIARHTRMHGASVTYTPESWRYINDKLAERYPEGDAVIVGWYHTHPGFGIFLSGMDLFIHQNFFTQIWHVALVLDPRAQRTGFFCWDRHKSRVDPYELPWPAWARNSW